MYPYEGLYGIPGELKLKEGPGWLKAIAEEWEEDPGGVEDPDYAIIRLRPSFLQGYHQLEHYHIDTGDV